jgi:prevent-host-death family protein
MKRWSVQDAKARFSEFLETCLNEGAQVVTKRGADAAVLVRVQDWQRLQQSARPTLKELLLSSAPRADLAIPKRGRFQRRSPGELG